MRKNHQNNLVIDIVRVAPKKCINSLVVKFGLAMAEPGVRFPLDAKQLLTQYYVCLHSSSG